MASPMLDGRSLNPREKAHFSVQISDRIAHNESSSDFASVKYNHKPPQTTTSRSTTLTSSSSSSFPSRYSLKITDTDDSKQPNIFTFTGQRTTPPPKKQQSNYVLLFDSARQKATLEPLTSTYTFNIATKNKSDISSSYPAIYPKKNGKEDAGHIQNKDGAVNNDEDLFDEGPATKGEDASEDPDTDNPYDYRHFLTSEKKGDESEYGVASSPDEKTTGMGSGSATHTPVMPARKQTTSTTSTTSSTATASARQKPAQPAPRKKQQPSPKSSAFTNRRTAAPKKTTTSQTQNLPGIRLERRATQNKPEKKPTTTAPSGKVKSAEIVHSSDESDIDAEGEVISPAAYHDSSQSQSQSQPHHTYNEDEDEDEEMEDIDIDTSRTRSSGLIIEDPDASRPRMKNTHNALSSLGLGQNIGLGGRGASRGLSSMRSPSAGPISLASAANSVEGSPRGQNTQQDEESVIDFGEIRAHDSDEEEDDEGGFEHDDEGEEEQGLDDGDVEPMDIGPPAQQEKGAAGRRVSVGGGLVDEDADGEGEEEDPLYKEMMEGLAGDSSEESEEE